MISKKRRFISFILKEKTQNFLAFAFFVLFLITFFNFGIPLILKIICYIILALLSLIGTIIYINDLIKKLIQTDKKQRKENRIRNLKLIAKEFIMFIPIWAITITITSLCQFQSASQESVKEIFKTDPICYSIMFIIICPIVEEFIFRLLPYRFIKDQTLYILFSSIIFAGLHIVNDPNPLYHIWFYMARPFYYAYRYYKTENLRVPICLHSFNNLIATFCLILSCF